MTATKDKIWQVGELLATTTTFLREKGAQSPRLDAEILLATVLKMPRVKLYINFEQELKAEDLTAYRELVRRRAKLEPVAYILGEKEFYGLSIKVGPEVLIPRPATEHLIDAVLREAKNAPFTSAAPLSIADIGTGSGAISLALAKNLPQAAITAVDISPTALALAQKNADVLGLLSQIEFLAGDLLAPLADRKFHFICANLPYIPSSEMAGLMPDVGQHEPHLALDGGPQGLTLIARLLNEAAPKLYAGGLILLEIWPDSLAELEALAASLGFLRQEVVMDLEGHCRLVIFKTND